MDKEIYVSYLDSDEYIKWNGKPSIRIRFNMLYFIGSLFIAALHVVAVSNIINIAKADGLVTDLITSVFLAVISISVSAVFVFALFILPVVARKKTEYVLTNKKIIQKYGKQIKTVSLYPLPKIQLITEKKDFGSVIVGIPDAYHHIATGMYPQFNRNCIIIADINVPEKVYKMIKE